jgi:hypothetical protein
MPDPGPDQYWTKVEQTLRRVFARNDAAELVQDYRRSAEALGPSEETGVFHLDPLQVAADLGGACDRSLTVEERNEYLELQREWYPAADLPGPLTGYQPDVVQFKF